MKATARLVVTVVALVLAALVLWPRPIAAQLNRVSWNQIVGGIAQVTKLALATTSTDGFTVQNTTAATSGVPVQMSPRYKYCGTAYNSTSTLSETDCMWWEVLPVTVAGTTTQTAKLGSSINGGAATYPLTVTSGGALAAAGRIDTTVLVSSGGIYPTTASASELTSSSNKLLAVLDAAGATGMEMNAGSATLGTCTGGTIVTGSHNFAGGYTGNTSSSCVVNFGTPAWTNAPFCIAMSTASTTHPRISAVSTSAMTVTGGVSGEAITYLCVGRIGT